MLYCNANGARNKIKSIEKAARTKNAHVICIAETKSIPPRIPGYSEWHMGNKRERYDGGGVAIAVREDIEKESQPVEDLETQDQEVAWIQINTKGKKKISVGVYYGKQEKDPRDSVEREFSQLRTQITKLKNEGPIILVGDFNAKLKVEKQGIKQEMSRNGELLQDLLDQTDMYPISLVSQTGTWTWENRHNPQQKSIIDYMLINRENANQIEENIVDEAGYLRAEGSKQSDHNTMFIRHKIDIPRKERTIKKWRTKNKEGWKNFNELMHELHEETLNNYDEFEKTVNDILEKTIGSINIRTTGKKKHKKSEETKKAEDEVKQTRKEFNKAIKENDSDKALKLTKYLEAQENLSKENEKDIINEIEENVRKIIREGGVKSKTFQQTRRKISKKGNGAEYTTIDENGTPIEDPEKAKEHIANYYENLYKAREARPEFKDITLEIIKTIEQIENEESIKKEPETLKQEELKEAIKSLKREKAPGPDGLPNEIFKEADEETIEVYRKVFDQINKKKTIPNQWQKGTLIRLDKGKGKRGKCSNERGITLSSNVGKTFERVINNRATQVIQMSENQAGGRKGKATVDHIAILNEAIQHARKKNKQVHITFLDVTKAYDKAWLDAIMYVMHKEGLDSPEWQTIKRLNEHLTAVIKTKYGDTREIKITDSIRQGGVLSVAQYALLMDEISKEIEKENIGIYVPSLKEKIGCLLWMDDVILISTDPIEHQRMLDITYQTAGKYHIEFGEEKSKCMKIGKPKIKPTFKLGPMTLEYCTKYKYLGFNQNEKNNMKDHLNMLKGKVESAYQTILAITGNRDMANIEMKALWELLECTIVPIITYACETWNPNKSETSIINSLLDNIIRRILMTPQSTPREALYIETGLLDPETIQHKQRITMNQRITLGTSERMKNLATNTHEDSHWQSLVNTSKQKLQVEPNNLIGKINTVKKAVKKVTMEYFKTKMENDAKDKSKVQHLIQGKKEWKPDTRSKCYKNLCRIDCSTIFKARTRMLDIKNNYRNKYKDLTCRACKKEPETQEHVMEKCSTIHKDPTTTVPNEDLFEENTQTLRITAKKVRTIIETLQKP